MDATRDPTVMEAARGLKAMLGSSTSIAEDQNKKFDADGSIATRRSRRRTANRFKEGTHLVWKFKSQSRPCTFVDAGNPRKLPIVKFSNGTEEAVQMSDLYPENFKQGDTVQCQDLKSQDPHNRQYWYDAKVVEIKRNNLGRTTGYVVQPVNDDEKVTLDPFYMRNLLWKKHQPEAVSAGPSGPTRFQEQCAAEEDQAVARAEEEKKKKTRENAGRSIEDMIPPISW